MEISLLENKTIYFVGCSYTWGAGLEMEYYHNDMNWDIEKIQKENDMSTRRLENGTYEAAEYRRKNRFGNLVAKHFNINHEVLNMGNGGDNELSLELFKNCPLSVPKIIVIQLTHFARSISKYSTNTDWLELSDDEIYNHCKQQIQQIINWINTDKQKDRELPKVYFLAWHKEFGNILRKDFPNRFIPIHIDGVDYDSFERTCKDFNNHNIKHNHKLRLCDVISGINDTHLSSIGHKIVADSIIKKLKNEYI